MVDTAWGGARDADLIALLVDARKGLTEEVENILKRLSSQQAPKVLILNKTDVAKREKLLQLAQKINEFVPFEETFMVSALTGDGTETILDYFASKVPDGPWLFPEDQPSDLPLRILAAEITREKLFERLHEELPYISTVETEQWQARKDGSARIETDHLRGAGQPEVHRARQTRTDDQGDFTGSARRTLGNHRSSRPPVPVREGSGELGRRSGALPGNGTGISEIICADRRIRQTPGLT